MPSWYNTGTVNVTNGSPAIVGIGTAWINSVVESDAFHGPDGRIYEIAEINSNTSLTLARQYLGDDATNQKYQVQPTRGLTISLVEKAQALLSTVQGYVNGALSGIFQNGSAGTPAIRFVNDLGMGIYRKAAGVIGFSTGGTERASLSATEFKIDVPVAGLALQSNPTDTTAGKLLTPGAFGLGLDAGPLIANIDTQYTSGFYYGYGGSHPSASPGANPFPFQNGAFSLIVNSSSLGSSSEFITQFATEFGDNGKVAYRSKTPSGWSGWRYLTPERGSNANGEYVRFPDGTQICTKTYLFDTGASPTDIKSVLFPASFVGGGVATHVDASIRYTIGGPDVVARKQLASEIKTTISSVSAGAWEFRANGYTGGNIGVQPITLYAFGRWF